MKIIAIQSQALLFFQIEYISMLQNLKQTLSFKWTGSSNSYQEVENQYNDPDIVVFYSKKSHQLQAFSVTSLSDPKMLADHLVESSIDVTNEFSCTEHQKVVKFLSSAKPEAERIVVIMDSKMSRRSFMKEGKERNHADGSSLVTKLLKGTQNWEIKVLNNHAATNQQLSWVNAHLSHDKSFEHGYPISGISSIHGQRRLNVNDFVQLTSS